MCFQKTPKPVRRDLDAEQRAAELKATEKANADIAGSRARRKSQSLIANPFGAAGLGSAITQVQNGRATLG